jgi:hypothetical protein
MSPMFFLFRLLSNLGYSAQSQVKVMYEDKDVISGFYDLVRNNMDREKFGL